MLTLHGSRITVPGYSGPADMRKYSRKLGATRRAEMEAARICLEAGATAEQAREAAQGNPVLAPLAEAMQQQAGSL